MEANLSVLKKIFTAAFCLFVSLGVINITKIKIHLLVLNLK